MVIVSFLDLNRPPVEIYRVVQLGLTLKPENMSNVKHHTSISGVKSSWTTLYIQLTVERAEERDDERSAEDGDEDEDDDADGLRLSASGDVAPAALVQLAFRRVVEAVSAVA